MYTISWHVFHKYWEIPTRVEFDIARVYEGNIHFSRDNIPKYSSNNPFILWLYKLVLVKMKYCHEYVTDFHKCNMEIYCTLTLHCCLWGELYCYTNNKHCIYYVFNNCLYWVLNIYCRWVVWTFGVTKWALTLTYLSHCLWNWHRMFWSRFHGFLCWLGISKPVKMISEYIYLFLTR